MRKHLNAVVVAFVAALALGVFLTLAGSQQARAAPSAFEVSVYNTLYGTALDAAGLDALLFPTPDDEIWVEFNGGARARAKFAGFTQTFGFYTDLGTGAVRTNLFSNVGTGGFISLGPVFFDPNVPFGFFTDPSGSGPFFSETAINPDSFDHFRMYTTPNAGQIVVFTEDLPFGGDKDFVDFVVEIDQVTPAIIDHFLCYEAEGNEVERTVSLEDQFGLELEVEVEEPELFCNPVAKNGMFPDDLINPEAHLTGYEIEDEGEEVERVVVIENQFGQQTLTVEEPELLFVPTGKLMVDGVPTGLDEPKGLDHFKCYEAEGDPVNVTVSLQDQFGLELLVEVEEPELFCNPVAKDVIFPVDLINPEAHLTCYVIEDEDEVERDVILTNQFGQGQMLEVEEPELLCVPSEKTSVETVVDDDDDDDD